MQICPKCPQALKPTAQMTLVVRKVGGIFFSLLVYIAVTQDKKSEVSLQFTSPFMFIEWSKTCLAVRIQTL